MEASCSIYNSRLREVDALLGRLSEKRGLAAGITGPSLAPGSAFAGVVPAMHDALTLEGYRRRWNVFFSFSHHDFTGQSEGISGMRATNRLTGAGIRVSGCLYRAPLH